MLNKKTKQRQFDATDQQIQASFLEAFHYAEKHNLPKGSTICSNTGLSPQNAKMVHYELMAAEKIHPEKINFVALEELIVNSNGSVTISAGRFNDLGLGTSFPPNALIKASASDGKLILEAVKDEGGKIKFWVKDKKKKKVTSEDQLPEITEGEENIMASVTEQRNSDIEDVATELSSQKVS